MLLAACSDDGSSSSETPRRRADATTTDGARPPTAATEPPRRRARSPPPADAGHARRGAGRRRRRARRLRPARHHALPAAVPQQRVHHRRHRHRHRPARRTARRTACPPTPTASSSTPPSGTATTGSARTLRCWPSCPTSTPTASKPADRGPTSAPRSPTTRRSCSSTPPPANGCRCGPRLDAHADDPADRLLTIRPAISPARGPHLRRRPARHVRHHRRRHRAQPPRSACTATTSPPTSTSIEARRPAMEDTFTALAGRRREPRASCSSRGTSPSPARATSASGCCTSATRRSTQLGDVAPAYTITAVTPNSDDNIALQIDGTFTVPNFLTGDGGARQPVQLRERRRRLAARDQRHEPHAAGAVRVQHQRRHHERHRAGAPRASTATACSATTTRSTPATCGRCRNEHNVVHCATKWAGMSEDDIGNAAATLGRVQQLRHDGRPPAAGRAQPDLPRPADDPRRRPRRRPELPACRRHAARSTRDHLDYDGNSQGGIMGADARCGVARHRARRARRARHELQPAAAPLGRLRRLRGRSSSRPTRTTSTGC